MNELQRAIVFLQEAQESFEQDETRRKVLSDAADDIGIVLRRLETEL